MKKNKKIVIISGIILIILVLCIGIGIYFWKEKNKPVPQDQEKEYVQTLEDGTKLNISQKLSETKTIDGLEITEIQLTEKGNTTQLLGTITNKTDETKPASIITITFLDKQGNEITSIKPYIKELKPGENTPLNASTTFDYTNAYDIKITK